MIWYSPTERWWRVIPLVVALGAAPDPLAAQAVQGRVLEVETEEPVVSAVVQLLRGDEGDHVVASSVTDEQGHFRLRAPASGTYRLRSLRIGYQAVITPPFDLLGGEAPLEVEVRLSAVTVELAPLTIVSERPPRLGNLRLDIAGYYERKDTWGRQGLGIGHFLEREDIDRTNPSRVSDVVRMLRGVQVESAGGLRQVITLRGHGSIQRPGGRCIPAVFVDGAPGATGADIDYLLSPWSLAAIEVYPGLSKPAEFFGGEDPGAPACGVLALWTGGGRRSNSNPERVAVAIDQARAAMLPQLALHLTLATDSLTLRDSVWATLTIGNLSDDTKSLCITDSRYTLRGLHTNRDIVEKVDNGPCVHVVDLAPRASFSWRELLAFFAVLDQPDEVLIQKHFWLRYPECGDEGCEVQLSSGPHRLAVYRDEDGL
ncbi:MAG: carboxypeptidase regulatory-like domain-containing protein [Acidimicrobiia bacterium]